MLEHGRAMKIIFYGKLAGELGRELDIALDGPCTICGLRERVIAAFPSAAQLLSDERVRACVGSQIVPGAYSVEPTDEVEFLAPVSGG